MSATRVLIVDDQASFRRQLRQLLTHAGLTVVGEAGDVPEAKELTRELQPDLAIVDVSLPGENGLSGTPQLRALAPKMRVILVSAHNDSGQVLEKSALEAGAEAFIPKDDLELEVVKKWADAGHDSNLWNHEPRIQV
ncbi:MAG TPA: response regulator transcription factor [Anaerolineales bacterium]|nr:response regulator transcription factor [Anaerolineales bacterium]